MSERGDPLTGAGSDEHTADTWGWATLRQERASWAVERAALVEAGNGLAAFLASDEWMDPTTDDECSNVLNTWYAAIAADSQTEERSS